MAGLPVEEKGFPDNIREPHMQLWIGKRKGYGR